MIDRTIQQFRLSAAVWGAALLLFSCSGKTEKPDNSEQPAIPEAAISLSAGQMEYLGLATGSLQMRTLHESVLANGYIEAPPQNRALVNPLISGHISTVRVIVGDRVKTGQVLAEMQSLEYIDMQRDYLDLKARADFSKRDLERQKVLNQEDAVSQRRLQEAESSWQSTRAQYMGLREKLRLIGTDLEALDRGEVQRLVLLRSPIGGSVRRLEVVPGQYVEPHQNLFEILNTDHLHVQLNLFEKDLIRVHRGQKVMFSIASLGDQRFEGEVYQVGQNLDPDRRTAEVHVHFDEKAAPFEVGMYLQAEIRVEENEKPCLPLEAVVYADGRSRVFVKIGHQGDVSEFTVREVSTGQQSDDWIEIRPGSDLNAGDTVVTKGAFYLLNAVTEPGGHHH